MEQGKKCIISCALGLFLAVFALALLPVTTTTVQAAEYQLASGDQIRIKVFGEDALSGEFQIDPSGKLSLPLVGEVNARGQTVRQLEETIAERLKDGYLKDPKVNVDVLSYRPVYVLGEVNRPGQYQYVDGMTVLTAVAMAGGFTYRAKKDNPAIIRDQNGTKVTLELTPEAGVLPGDVVRIPERYF